MSYWQNYGKFRVSLIKAWFGDAASKENNWCFDWLPKLDKPHDVLQVFEDMYQGRMNGYLCQGFNALAAFPNKPNWERSWRSRSISSSWILWQRRRRSFGRTTANITTWTR